ncbi:MAG: Fic family protein [Propionibacteriaceae bacterium]|jgi:Fic family protein|nr:Fic family protein [Propionibacteriaceae bacterium]
MDPMISRAGTTASNLSGDASYLSFSPAPLPPNPPLNLDDEAIRLLVRANAQLARLGALAEHVPDSHLFISMYVRKEALMSSQIEGTQATLEDILDPDVEENADRDVAEVVSYIHAMEFAVERLGELPLCNRLLKETHSVLMANTRGQEKEQGEFRRSQNWIGPAGSNPTTAPYVPPAPQVMRDALADLEAYINVEPGHPDVPDPLVRAALIHYQFETIHPFLDGNGRLGRLLIVLFLLDQKVLASPILYPSYALKANRVEYYDRMTDVRRRGDFEQWVAFFLRTLAEAAEDASATIEKLVALHERSLARVDAVGRSSSTVVNVFHHLEAHPIVTIAKVAEDLGLSFSAANSAITRLRTAGIVEQVSEGRRNRVFAYREYLDLLRPGT